MNDAEKLQAILNLACVVMKRDVTPAICEEVIKTLLYLDVDGRRFHERFDEDENWFSVAREACPNWRTI